MHVINMLMSKTSRSKSNYIYIKDVENINSFFIEINNGKKKSVNHNITHLKRAIIKRKFQFAHSKEKTAFLAQMPEEYAKRDLQFTCFHE